jgi:glycosyltransferase involved in cell wall biosynthesis
LQNLKLSEESIINVSTALDANFLHCQVDSESQHDLKKRLGITRSMILYSGGADQRKNLPRLIQSYAALPVTVRAKHQLVFAGKMPDGDISRFKQIAMNAGLVSDELCFTDYVSDVELIQLYSLCTLYVFPSWHEGFGLPALEAMACGAPVIAANTSSLPEVINNTRALFDPFDLTAITGKIHQALTNEKFREDLRAHGKKQAARFSWDMTATRAIAAWARLDKKTNWLGLRLTQKDKPKLAFVSPLPPERTGIADYSAELLPELSKHYDIELVVAQSKVDDARVTCTGKVRSVEWFREHSAELDRVIYQIGNSPFHEHMFPLLQEIPGSIVLHDFYLSAVKSWKEMYAGEEHTWTRSLYDAHGYKAVALRFKDPEAAKKKYPVNFDILQNAQGVIVHSNFSRRLAYRWYGQHAAYDWAVIPHLRALASIPDKPTAKKQLGFTEDDFLTCSFGFLDSTKLNHRLLNCWLASSLSQDPHCHLIFVGENHGGEYGRNLLRIIQDSGLAKRIHVTGFVSRELFEQYLASTDLAIQLRADSRGETSGTSLDSMSYSLPLVVNANGSMAELPDHAVWKIPDHFSDSMLIDALETLRRDEHKRRLIGERARQIILDDHQPARCARQYAEAIEYFHHRSEISTPALLRAVARQIDSSINDVEVRQLASSIADTHPFASPAKRLFLDLTATIRHDLKTGIERVARALLLAFIENPPKGYRVEPVYLDQLDGKWAYRYARRYMLGLLDCPVAALDDEVIDPSSGDIILGLDLSGDILVQAQKGGVFAEYRNRGIAIYFMVHDLLPVIVPAVFPPGSDKAHVDWLVAISNFDGAVCVSESVAQDFQLWQETQQRIQRTQRKFFLGWSHHGADMTSSAPTRGLPENYKSTLAHISSRLTFLMVGTIEPRKAYRQTIDAFTLLWAEGLDVNLVIVGKEGWRGLDDNARRDIPETLDCLRTHPEKNRRLLWLDAISDEYLETIYDASTCLIAASYGEGFGLPLIEAAKHKLPIIARDIPVFREVSGDNAYYFVAQSPRELARAIYKWVQLYKNEQHPKSDDIRWLTWNESAKKLFACIRPH